MDDTEQTPPPDDEWVDLQIALGEAGIVDLVSPDDPHDIEWVTNMLRSTRAFEMRIEAIQAKRRVHVVAATEEAMHFDETTFDTLTREASNRRRALGDWAVLERSRTGEATFSFPAGTIRTTRTAARWTWPDDDGDLVAWLKDSQWQDLLRVTEKVDKTAVKAKAIIKDGVPLLDGEALPGVTVAIDEMTASVVL